MNAWSPQLVVLSGRGLESYGLAGGSVSWTAICASSQPPPHASLCSASCLPLRCESSASCSSPHACHWLLCLPTGMNSNLLELYAQINSSRSCFRSGHFIIATEKPPICPDKRPQPKQARGGRADLGSRFQCTVYGEDVKAAGV